MSTNTDILRPLNRKSATVRGRAITLTKPGSVTQNFFARGEEQEATGYENLAADDPILAPPALEFDSFDKIPRRRGSWFAIAVSMLVVAAIGFVTWRSFHFLSRPGSSVAAASRAMVQSPPPAPAAPVAQPMTVAPSEPITQSAPVALPAPVAQSAPTSGSAAVASPAPVTKPEPVVEPPPVTKPAPVVEPLPNPRPGPVAKHAPVVHEPAANDTDDEPVQMRKHAPLHGYVWSPDRHTLVPAEPVIEDLPTQAPRSQSLDGTPAQEPQPAPDPTSPAPFQPSPAPSSPPSPNQAPVIE